MTETQHEPMDDPMNDEEAAPAGDPGSILASLRAEFANATLDEVEDFEIPPAPGLMLRCKYVPTETFDAKGKKLAKIKDEGVQTTLGACDVLYEACEQIMVYGPGGQLHPLKWLLDEDGDPDPDVGEYEPTRFDADACQILGWDPKLVAAPRKMVLKLFKGNAHAVRVAAFKVSKWMDSVGSGAQETLRGE